MRADTENGESPSRTSSPPTDRVVAIIGLLANDPTRAFGLADLARELEISKATCHAILQRLVVARFLTRSDSGYSLGPGLIAAGQAAERSLPGLRAARPLLGPLADEFEAEAIASVRDKESILIVGWTSSSGSTTSRVGERIPFAPPFGAIQVAWSSDEEIEDWFGRSPNNSEKARKDMDKALQSIRRRGFDVHRESDVSLRVREVLNGMAAVELTDPQRKAVDLLFNELSEVNYLPDELVEPQSYSVNTISAAAFDSAGRTALVLSLLTHRHMRGDEILQAGARLRSATSAVTQALGGHLPDRNTSRG